MGRPRYRRARSLLITADAGGSNGARLRLWTWELQQLAERLEPLVAAGQCLAVADHTLQVLARKQRHAL
jgi:hypothetical protein